MRSRICGADMPVGDVSTSAGGPRGGEGRGGEGDGAMMTLVVSTTTADGLGGEM
jgi:hypothetical protein